MPGTASTSAGTPLSPARTRGQGRGLFPSVPPVLSVGSHLWPPAQPRVRARPRSPDSQTHRCDPTSVGLVLLPLKPVLLPPQLSKSLSLGEWGVQSQRGEASLPGGQLPSK